MSSKESSATRKGYVITNLGPGILGLHQLYVLYWGKLLMVCNVTVCVYISTLRAMCLKIDQRQNKSLNARVRSEVTLNIYNKYDPCITICIYLAIGIQLESQH